MTAPSNLLELAMLNTLAGGHWFDDETMEFFNTRTYDSAVDEEGDRLLFITSDRDDFVDGPTLYSLRAGYPDGRVRTVSRFQQFDSLLEAQLVMSLVLKGSLSDDGLVNL